MSNRYALQQVGVLDGTLNPPKQADGRQVNAKERVIVCSKAIVADAIGDTITLCRLPANCLLTEIQIITDTSLSTATIAIGIAGTPAKYVAATTFTTPLDKPASLGPKAAAIAAGPIAAEETLIATVAALALPGAAVVHFIIKYVTNN